MGRAGGHTASFATGTAISSFGTKSVSASPMLALASGGTASGVVAVVGVGTIALGAVTTYKSINNSFNDPFMKRAVVENEVNDIQLTYETSPKHNPQSGWGSENPIPNNKIGKEFLNSAYSSEKKKQLFNIYNNNIVKFQPDATSNNWHSYKVSNTAVEVPIDVYKQMLNEGVISKSDYAKLIKNNWY